METIERNYLEVDISFLGIAKRDRKEKRHRITLCDLNDREASQIDLAQFIPTAKERIAREGYKSVRGARITTTKCKDITYDGRTIKEVHISSSFVNPSLAFEL